MNLLNYKKAAHTYAHPKYCSFISLANRNEMRHTQCAAADSRKHNKLSIIINSNGSEKYQKNQTQWRNTTCGARTLTVKRFENLYNKMFVQ